MDPELSSSWDKSEVFDLYQAVTEHLSMYCPRITVYLFIMEVITFRLLASASDNKLKHFVSVLDVNKDQWNTHYREEIQKA